MKHPKITSVEFSSESMSSKFLVCLIVFLGSHLCVYAQENIPLGAWRAHLSFNAIKFIAKGDQKIFAATNNSVMRYDAVTQEFLTYSSLDALSGTGISAIAFDTDRNQLIVGYVNGGIDLISDQKSIQFTRLINPPDLTVSSAINHIYIQNSFAYLSTNYGVVVLDLTRNSVRETWRNLGDAGQLLAVHQTIVKGTEVFLGTARGVLVGNTSNNLLDFSQWVRFASGDFAAPVEVLSLYKTTLVAAISSKGIYQFSGSAWQMQNQFPVLSKYTSMEGDVSELLVTGDGFFYNINSLGEVFLQEDTKLLEPVAAIRSNNAYWVGSLVNGMLTNQEGTWNSVLPNGPGNPFVSKTKNINDYVVALHGGFTNNFSSSNTYKGFSRFKQGLWTSEDISIDFLTDVAAYPSGEIYVASFGEGLVRIESNGDTQTYDKSNSSLEFLTSIATSRKGLWIASYGKAQSLHLMRPDQSLQSFSFTSSAARYPFALAIDASENIWMLLAPTGGGGIAVVNNEGILVRLLSEQSGSGLLPSREVLSIAVDKNDYVWVGTAKGVVYYAFLNEDGIKPIVEGRALLGDERVTAIAVDGGNRKWIGTERGLWLFSSSGEEVINFFTTANSPIPSNFVKSIEIDPRTGEVFITTEKGLVSYRSDATEPKSNNTNAKIFPNPVNPGFSGIVAIANLYSTSQVKITDVSGKLIRQVEANGGTASWDLLDQFGRRVSTGVYLVLATTETGSQSLAGKIVVVD